MRNMIRIGIVGCSNGQKMQSKAQNDALFQTLAAQGLNVQTSRFLYQDNDGKHPDARDRAEELMRFYRNDGITDIFDISGGDIANEVLPFLDYTLIAKSNKRFWGYSDLTVIHNAIYSKTGKCGILYQIRNTQLDATGEQLQMLLAHLGKNADELFRFDCEFVQGEQMDGVIIGGNIRCFLKLAGTPYFPDLTGKILFLEARSGGIPQLTAYLSQLNQMGAFEKVAGILLGTFTQMEEVDANPTVVELIKRFAGAETPIAKTNEIGHSVNSKALAVGKYLELHK